MTAMDTPQDIMCRLMGISKPTLELRYRDELDLGMWKAKHQIGQRAFQIAMNEDDKVATPMVIYLSKARLGWRDHGPAEGAEGERGKANNININITGGVAVDRIMPDDGPAVDRTKDH
jgi:hypothetical protein